MPDRLVITKSLSLPLSELSFRASRSGGPGGQHVNTTNSRIELLFDVAQSPSLGPRQRARLLQRLASRLDSRGVLHLACQDERSQGANKAIVVERLKSLLAEALRRPKKRRPTKPTAASRERRRQGKEHRSKIKRQRRSPSGDDS